MTISFSQKNSETGALSTVLTVRSAFAERVSEEERCPLTKNETNLATEKFTQAVLRSLASTSKADAKTVQWCRMAPEVNDSMLLVPANLMPLRIL